jgi:hypothetical protein
MRGVRVATVILRVPSKIQYGYVEIQATPEELGGDAALLSSPELLAEMYVRYTKDFREREEQALKAAAPTPKPKAEVTLKELGDAMADMAKATAPTLKSETEESFSIASLDEAEKLLVQTLGATVMEENAPYKKTPPAAKAKPWEEKGAVKAPDLGDLFA